MSNEVEEKQQIEINNLNEAEKVINDLMEAQDIISTYYKKTNEDNKKEFDKINTNINKLTKKIDTIEKKINEEAKSNIGLLDDLKERENSIIENVTRIVISNQKTDSSKIFFMSIIAIQLITIIALFLKG